MVGNGGVFFVTGGVALVGVLVAACLPSLESLAANGPAEGQGPAVPRRSAGVPSASARAGAKQPLLAGNAA